MTPWYCTRQRYDIRYRIVLYDIVLCMGLHHSFESTILIFSSICMTIVSSDISDRDPMRQDRVAVASTISRQPAPCRDHGNFLETG